MILASFIACLTGFLALGIASFLRSRNTTVDYYCASRSVHPALVGLSAVATNNSGYMFIGVIGYTWTVGLSSVWLMVGWILGDWLGSLHVHRKLRVASERLGSVSYAGLLGEWGGETHAGVRRVAAVLTVVFLGAYAAAQMSAGGKALQAVFDWQPQTGAILVAAMVAVYCMAGGIRASIWTDAAQALVMIVAMALLLGTAITGLGGLDASIARLDTVPGFLDWFPGDLLVPGTMGMLLFVAGWLFAGLSVIGQPHVMIRFMTLDDPAHMTQARVWYYGFFFVFYAMATAVGLLSRIYLPGLGELDPELALPTMATQLLPPVLVGLILAGIFAATMSTADSLVLSCSASLTQDLPSRPTRSKWISKGATLAVTVFALGIAIAGPASVFSLVILAWSTLAAAFAPLLLVYASGRRVSQRLALAMMITGPAVALGWRVLGWHTDIYEGMPGILAGLAVYAIGRRLARSARSMHAPAAGTVPGREENAA